jgi:hypothetical protein
MKCVFLLLLALMGLWLAGCGGANSLTGGSVPIGTIDGWVYRSVTVQPLTRAETALQAVSGMTVELVRDGGQILRTTTDATGYFIFRNVPRGPVRIRAGQLAALYAEVQSDVERDGDRVGVALLLAPELAEAPVSLLITPAAVGTAHAGDEIAFTAHVVTADQRMIEVPASWALQGEIGTFTPRLPAGSITPHGLFHATVPGSGRIIAQYKGLIAIAPITVLPAGVTP